MDVEAQSRPTRWMLYFKGVNFTAPWLVRMFMTEAYVNKNLQNIHCLDSFLPSLIASALASLIASKEVIISGTRLPPFFAIVGTLK